MSILESYNKDGTTLGKMNIFSEDKKPIKMIDNENNRTTDYKYEFNVVKDTDIFKPDTTGYEVK